METHTAKPIEGETARRAHVVIPAELLNDVDALVGPRRRSEFFAAAVREKLERERLRRVAHQLAGSLKDSDTPGWETPEATSVWVRNVRVESDRERHSDQAEP